MSLAPGFRLGAYEILSLLGAGGMGEVYKARDTRLDRTVAIKVMPPELAADAQFRARFDREARAISQLQHPRICTLYDVGEINGTAFLVMELLQGQTLADRVKKGALPLDDAVKIAIDVADALSAAHKQGIVHRDLKPANIMLTKSGAKLLDFGLAKPAAPVFSMSAAADTAASTSVTGDGTIVGTPHYMSPEQVEGIEADARSDIWAFGVVLYEIVTGTLPFDGDSGASIIGAILKDTPPAVSSRQPLSPPALDSIVEQCLRKDSEERWQSATDISRTLRWVAAGIAPDWNIPTRSHRTRMPWLIAATAVAAALVVLGWPLMRRSSETIQERRIFSIALAPNTQIAGASAVSPDGSRFAFVGLGPDGPPNLFVISLRAGTVLKLSDTEYASLPFWSPAGDMVGFFANGKLKVVSANGGNPKVLASAQNGRGATWGRDGTILFVPEPNAMVFRISDKGGEPAPVTVLDAAHGEIGHRWPTVIDDRHFVFTMQSAKADATGLYLATVGGPPPTKLNAQYSNSAFIGGRLLFVANGMIVAQQLDVTNSRLLGDPMEVAGPASFSGGLGFESFSATADGSVLAYAPGTGVGATTEIAWLDRGQPKAAPSPMETTTDLRQYNAYFEQLSRDGGKLVVSQFRIATADLWLFDIRRDVLTRFTFDDATELNPVWSPDDTEMMFSSNRGGFYNIYRKPVSGASPERVFMKAGSHQYVTDWSRDGRTIIYTNVDSGTASDIWSTTADGRGQPLLVQRTPFNEYAARLSPDARWIAYTSDESGQPEIYVQRFPSGEERSKVSSQGGSEPQWRADGGELFYLGANHALIAVPISLAPVLNIGRAVRVHETGIDTSIGSMHGLHYTPSADGQRFLASVLPVGPPTTIVLNWQAGLRP